VAIMKGSGRTKLDVEANNRDGNRCIKCGKKTGIETHHIIPELEELANLMTLCHGCHKKEHGFAGCFRKGVPDSRQFPKGNTIGMATRFQKGNIPVNKKVLLSG